MATTIAALAADISMDSAAFKNDLSKADRALKSSSARMNRALGVIDRGFSRMSRSVGGFVKGAVSVRSVAAGLAGAAGLGLLIKKSLDTADSIAKTSDAIGLSTDALQEYRFAADIAGVSTEQLDSGFAAFSKRLGELRAGTGTLVTILQKMDPALAENLKSANGTAAALDVMFGALSRLSSQSDRAALAAAAFGRTAGVAMTNLVKDGTASLDDMRRKARELGLVIDEELLRNSEKAKDQLTILGSVIKTRVTAAIVELAPEIVRITSAITESLPSLVSWVRQLSILFGILDPTKTEELKALEERLVSLNAKLQKNLQFSRDPENDSVVAGLREQIAKTEEQIRLFEELTRQEEEFEARRAKKPSPAAPAGASSGAAPPTFDERFDPEFEKVVAVLDGMDKEAKEAKDSLERMKDEARRVFEETRTPIERHNAELQRLNRLLEAGVIDWDTYQRAVQKADKELSETLQSTPGAMKTIEDGARDMFRIVVDGFGNARDSGRDFKDVIKDVTVSLIEMAAQTFVLDTLNSQLADMAKNMFDVKDAAKGTGGAVASSGGGAAGSFFGGLSSILFPGGGIGGGLGFASGGSFTVGGSGGTDTTPVGFMATRGERVTVETPAQQRRGASGPTVFIDNRGADVGAVARLERLFERMDMEFEERAVGAVVSERRRDADLFGAPT